MDHIFKQFVFECMDTASTNDEGMVIPSLPCDLEERVSTAIPWDDPYPYYRCMIPKEENIQEQFPRPEG